MTDRWDIARVVNECEQYWRKAGISGRSVVEMRLELQHHLERAVLEGGDIRTVVGSDLAAFAESWAHEQRGGRPTASWDEVSGGGFAERRKDTRLNWLYGAGAAALVAAALVMPGTAGENVDNEIWRWVWVGVAVLFGLAEIFTSGFFLLPFAIGATAATILAWLNVNIYSQWFTFFGVSLIFFVYMRRFVRNQDDADLPKVGANRLTGTKGVVTEAIDPINGTGWVRVESESWRAVTDGDPIEANTRVVVIGLRGARVVVSPLEDS